MPSVKVRPRALSLFFSLSLFIISVEPELPRLCTSSEKLALLRQSTTIHIHKNVSLVEKLQGLPQSPYSGAEIQEV